MKRRSICVLILLSLFVSPSAWGQQRGVEFLEKKIRPVLVTHCYACHSARAKRLQGGLRLDLKAGWQRGGASGEPAVVPGKPDESPLLLAIRHHDDVAAMPPNKPQLSPQIVDDVTQWIAMGAPDPRKGDLKARGQTAWEIEFQRRLDWWSLKPVARVLPPKLASAARLHEPIDRFILGRLQQRKLQFAPAADALTLLRRMSFLLTGLPPAVDEVKSFPAKYKADPQTALSQLADRLLASPHYGERLARRWMDVVRYTDTYGYEWDNPAKGAWQYRDYLIRAFNADVGFNQLVREQIAGDLLESPRIESVRGFNESLIGPMFFHMGEHRHGDNTSINGVREETIDNKIDAFSKAFLAMTVACARCHDHKLDAISQRDYYALASVFMTPRWTARSIESPDHNAAAIARLKQLRDAVEQRTQQLWKRQAIQLAAGDSLKAWAMANPKGKAGVGELKWLVTGWLDNSDSTANKWEKRAAVWRKTRAARRKANADRFTELADFSKPQLPPGWFAEGQGMQHGYVAKAKPLVALTGDRAVTQLLPPGYHTHALSSKLAGAIRLPAYRQIPGKHVSFALAGSQWSGFLKVADNGFQGESTTYLDQQQPTWRTLSEGKPANGIQRVAAEIATCDLNPGFLPRTGVAQANGKRLPDNDEGIDKRSWFSITGIVRHDQPGTPADALDEFAPLFESAPPKTADEIWPRIGRWLAGSVQRYAAGQPTVADVKWINRLLAEDLLPGSTKDDSRLAALVAEYRKVEATLTFPRTANSMDERGVRSATYALNIRGDINVRGEKIPHDFLTVFKAWHSVGESAGSGRRELARFLTDERHALVARVYVNRVWQWVFGAGLVRTPNDFGHLGEQPSHPKLLDYLTRTFVSDGWSTKRLIRRLVLSRTFRQSGAASEAARATDPGNRWLHHYPTRRLEAESIRDALLAASGRLVPRLFGRPINPRRRVEDSKKRLFSGPLDGHGRRSIYLEVSIMDRSKFLKIFNAPDPKIPTGVRDVANGPAQALAMLNDPFVIAMADRWAQRLVDSTDKDDARLRAVFLRALGRTPRAEEAQRFRALIQTLRSEKTAERDLWRHVTHTVFNLQEFIHYR